MKIAILTAEYPPYISGGVGTFSYELTKKLAELGHEVIVVTRSIRAGRRGDDGVRTFYLFSPNVPPRDVVYSLTRMRAIYNIIRREKPDVIHDVGNLAGYMPYVSKLAPVVSTIHGSPTLEEIRRSLGGRDYVRSLLFKLSHVIPAKFTGSLAKLEVKRYVFVSKFAMWDTLRAVKDEELRKALLRRSRVVYNGVDTKALREIANSVHDVDEGSVVFIGRLMEYKGVRWLVKAFKHVVDELPGAKLHIVGDGPIYKDIKGLVNKLNLEKNVAMHGALPRTEAMRVLAKSMVLTHPSLAESFGIVIAEAYAMGKPVIAHKSTYSYELVAETGAGLTINALNEREYAEAITQLLTDKNLYRRLSQRALEVSERFSVEAMVKGYLEVYREAINEA